MEGAQFEAAIVAPLPQIAKLLKIYKIMSSRFVSWFEYVYCAILNEGSEFGDGLSRGLIRKPTSI